MGRMAVYELKLTKTISIDDKLFYEAVDESN